jgi:hypothetical protein
MRARLRVLAGAAAVGLVVAGVIGGIGGRLAMRLLVLTSDEGLKGAITDDEAVVNQFTLGGTLSLIAFISLAGVALAWMYVGARSCLPSSRRLRASVWSALLWSVAGSTIYEPDGFDFRELEPAWLGVLLFSAIFVAMGSLLAIGVERAILRWPSSNAAIALPLAPLAVMFPLYAGGVLASAGASLSEAFVWVRRLGLVVMVGIIVFVGVPTAINVVRILV